MAKERQAKPLTPSVAVCYAQSRQVSDWRAHCWVAHRFAEDYLKPIVYTLGPCAAPPPPPDPTWFFPCRLAQPQAWKITQRHPAALRAQVEVVLHASDVRACPHIQDLDEWDLLQWGKPDGI